MYLKQLEINNFRNYDNFNIHLSPYINIFYGDNAQGKTNLLEAIYFLGLAKSHRTNNIENLLKSETSIGNVRGILNVNDENTNLFIGFTKDKKNLKVNDQHVSKNKDYISYMNIIFFGPDDLELIKGNPEIRRKYLNIQISQMSSSYSKVLDDYSKLLKMRNDYLSNSHYQFDASYFDILTSYLVDRAINIYKYRNNYIEKINRVIKDIFYKISNYPDLYIKYVPNIDTNYNDISIKDEIMKMYSCVLNDEKEAGKTLLGPHKDDFEYVLMDNNLKQYGSQGQQRMAVISLKLAEISVFNDLKQSTPIILLDDVFSELDDKKKNNLLNYIDDKAQVIITTTDLSNISDDIVKRANIIKINNGKLEKVE